jgi:hypothetical protein
MTRMQRFELRHSKLVWCVKQLLPLTYRTRYGDAAGQHFTVWRMWFGRCFAITDVLVEPTAEEAALRAELA